LFGKGHKKVQQELSESVSKKRPKWFPLLKEN
jgi:hypothetical protein